MKTNKHISDFLTEPLQSNFFLTPTLSQYSNKSIKEFGKTITIPLANLIHLSFECRIFSVSLKVASLTPVNKGDSLDCSNYHPVSLTSNLSKLIEKLVHKRLYNLLEKQKINATTSVKYLGVYINDSLTWEPHFKNLITKLNRAIRLLSKVRHYMPKFLLKPIYYSLFNLHLIYVLT